jgi:hypothetical protein
MTSPKEKEPKFSKTVMTRLKYIEILAKEERYAEIQALLETNFVLVA